MSKKPRPCVTIFSDASLFPDDGRAGWGCSILAGDAQLEHGAAFKDPVEDILQAEVQAAACALHLAASRGLLAGEPVVVVQIDSTDAIGVILASDSRYRYSAGPHGCDRAEVRSLPHVPARCVAAVRSIRAVFEAHKHSLYLRHVKGHRRHLSGRHRMNGRADKLARRAAEGARV